VNAENKCAEEACPYQEKNIDFVDIFSHQPPLGRRKKSTNLL